MDRRTFVKTTGGSAAIVLTGLGKGPTRAAADTAMPSWRTFEVTTRLDVADPVGVTRAWVPLPLMSDTDYQKRLGDTWKGSATVVRVYRDEKYDAGMLYAEWPSSEKAPTIDVVSRLSTRDRAVDLTRRDLRAAEESPGILKLYLAPTKLIPTDGLVLETSRQVTKGRRTDLDKARALYEWIVENTFRDPKVQGCGLGDIQKILDTRYFGGKCADLNALFVGLARAAGIPARDVYGVRIADSKEFKSLGRSGDVSKAQHCRAEFYLPSHGWIPVDPADVRKVVLEEPPPGRTLADPLVRRAREKLFGAWEMNYLVYNHAHDVKLPHGAGGPLPFLMYPQSETAKGRKDCLEPTTFRYRITAREVTV